MTISQAVADPTVEARKREKPATTELRTAIETHPDVRDFFHDAAAAHPEFDWNHVRQLASSGYILEAERAVRDVIKVPPHVYRCLGDSYSSMGWLTPASIAYELSGNRTKIAAAAERWLERGHFEEARRLLERTETPFTEKLLDVYFDACRRHSWHVHAAATKLRGNKAKE